MTRKLLDCQGNSGLSSSKKILDLSCVFVWFLILFVASGFFVFFGVECGICSLCGSLVEMYCPIVMIFPNLRRAMPSNGFSIVFHEPGIDIELGKMIKIGN